MAIVKRIRKNGSYAYLVRLQDRSGNWFPSKTFSRLIDAERYERKLKTESDKGAAAEDARKGKITFPEYWAQWQLTRGGRSLTLGWQNTQDQMARDYLLPMLGNLPLEQIGERHIAIVLKSMDAAGRKPSTKKNVFNLIHAILETAIREGFILKNPVALHLKPRPPRQANNYLTPDQAWKLLDAARSDFLAPAIWLATLAGLRCEAIQALRWECVDLEQRQILIKEAYKRKESRIGVPKGKDTDFVPIVPALADLLYKLKPGKLSRDFVAPGKAGGMLDHHVFNDGLRRLCAAAGVKRVTPHGLRHSCSEIWMADGASEEDLRRLFHHKNADTTRGYIHRTPDRLQRIAQGIKAPFISPSSERKATLLLVRQ